MISGKYLYSSFADVGAVVGGVIGGVVALAVIAGVVFFIYKKRR